MTTPTTPTTRAHRGRQRAGQRSGAAMILDLGGGLTLDVSSVGTILGSKQARQVDEVLETYAGLRHASARRVEAGPSAAALASRRRGSRS